MMCRTGLLLLTDCQRGEDTRWSGDVIWRTGKKNYNAVSHNRARPYFRIQRGRGEVRARQVYLNVHSVTGNVVDTEWSVEFWRWKCCREFGNNTKDCARLWDTALKFFFPVLQITSPDHLVVMKTNSLIHEASLSCTTHKNIGNIWQ